MKFDADREDKGQGQESMPVRLAKPYGGDVYGFHFPLIRARRWRLLSTKATLTGRILRMRCTTRGMSIL